MRNFFPGLRISLRNAGRSSRKLLINISTSILSQIAEFVQVHPIYRLLKAADICELLEVKQTSAYEIIGNLNKELEEQGYLTLRGKVPTKYFVKRFYGVEDTCEIPQEEGKEWFHA